MANGRIPSKGRGEAGTSLARSGLIAVARKVGDKAFQAAEQGYGHIDI